ncbi:MAG TPA: serine/threonine-protein kinase [Ktedonobacteraceae bacterium]|nr:serine/threonine-protein kinase [Ktedonobacteraceae bacterium]
MQVQVSMPALPARAPAEQLRPGCLFAQRYRIMSKVASGGFGVIYKAQDLDNHRRTVAIKQINLSMLSAKEMIEATDAYNREVAHLSKLKHGNLPRIYEYFTRSDSWYIVMDFIAGETLEEKLKKTYRKRLPLQTVIDIGIALCDVLAYLHTQHPPIIFRDVKPANIMVTRTGRVYLVDFGIARRYTPGRNKDTGALGSPGYAAPEQYGKAQTTEQTDVYGLAATLQTLLTGKEPLEITISSEKQKRRIQKKIPRKIQPLLQQMLEWDSALRPRSMGEVKERLQRLSSTPRRQKVRRLLANMRKSVFDALLFTMLVITVSAFMELRNLWLVLLTYIVLYFVALIVRLLKGGFFVKGA